MLSNLSDIIRLYRCCAKITAKSWFQYKVNACIQSFTVFLRESTNILIIYYTLHTFNNINGWNRNELFFLYSLLYITYGILIVFCTGLRDFDKFIADGTFDRFLLRPRGVLFQIIASNSDWFAALGHGGLGIVLFVVSANKLGIIWSVNNIIYYFIAILSGTFIQVSMFLSYATLGFFFIKSKNIRDLMYWQIRRFAGYPLSIFSHPIQIILTIIVPFAFVNYFPAQYLIRNEDMDGYANVLMYISPAVAVVMVCLSYCFWRYSLKKYTSTGN